MEQEVDKLLRNLQSADAFIRKTAAEEIGKLNSPQDHILRALKTVAESDENKYVRTAATQSYLSQGGQETQLHQEVETKSTPPLQKKCMLCSTNVWDIKKDLSFSSSKRVGYKTHQVTTHTLSNVLLCTDCNQKITTAMILSVGGGYLGFGLGLAISFLLDFFMNIGMFYLGILGCFWLLGMFLGSVYEQELKL